MIHFCCPFLDFGDLSNFTVILQGILSWLVVAVEVLESHQTCLLIVSVVPGLC